MKKNSNEKFTIITFAIAVILFVAILMFGRIILPVALVMGLAPINIFLEKIGIDEETAFLGGVLFLMAGISYVVMYKDKIRAKTVTKKIGIHIKNLILILIGSIVIAWILPKLGNIFFDGLEYVNNIFCYHFKLGDTLSFLLTFLTVFIGIPYVFYRFYRWFKKEYREKIRK
ncbi:hypothetical protein ES703_40968 [subsurface metagenome]